MRRDDTSSDISEKELSGGSEGGNSSIPAFWTVSQPTQVFFVQHYYFSRRITKGIDIPHWI